jgi:mRNA interferase MazF
MSRNFHKPDRGDVCWMILDPVKGHEQAGRRPVLVLSPSKFTDRTSLAVICPITTKMKGLPFEIPILGKEVQGAVLTIHVRSIDISKRQCVFIEKVPKHLVEDVVHNIAQIIGAH